ncbi:MAG TPA: class I SAM-dependent methyltransferase [Polyangia bacterium]
MNRHKDTPRAPTPVADAGPAGTRTLRGENEDDSLVEHDPTLKWIISDLAEAGEKTPPPEITFVARERTPPPLPSAAGKRSATLPESLATTARTPPPLDVRLADVKTPPPVKVAAPRTPAPAPKLVGERPTLPANTQGEAPLVQAIHGATPADFFAADSTPPPPPSPAKASEGVGAAPVGVLSGASGSDSELSADAVELLTSPTEDSGHELQPVDAAPSGPASSPALSANPSVHDTPHEGIRPGAPQLGPASETPTEPREVEPDAVEMLESAEHQTVAITEPTTPALPTPPHVPAEPATLASHAPTPPPVPTEPATPALHASAPPPVPLEPSTSTAIPPPPPAAIAAALFEEHQTPTKGGDAIPEALARRSLKKRAKPWYEEVFDEDFLRTLPFMTPAQTEREVNFIREALSPPTGGEVLDVGCGYGRHALELAQQGLRLTGLDLSLPMLIRAADHAQKRGLAVNFVHADMREMTYNGQFDAAYCVLSSFGYFDEETNLRVATAICRALKPGGRFLLDIMNRDYIVGDLPSRTWWEGDGCVVLEEVDFNYHTSRVLIRRSVVFGNGRQSEQEISLRAFSLHEVGKLLRQAGLRVLDVSGGLATKSRFYGSASRNIIAVCERPVL